MLKATLVALVFSLSFSATACETPPAVFAADVEAEWIMIRSDLEHLVGIGEGKAYVYVRPTGSSFPLWSAGWEQSGDFYIFDSGQGHHLPWTAELPAKSRGLFSPQDHVVLAERGIVLKFAGEGE